MLKRKCPKGCSEEGACLWHITVRLLYKEPPSKPYESLIANRVLKKGFTKAEMDCHAICIGSSNRKRSFHTFTPSSVITFNISSLIINFVPKPIFARDLMDFMICEGS